jgi:hypothetical protein
MNAYRLAWLCVSVGLAVVGTCAATIVLSVPASMALFGVAALLIGAVAINSAVGRDDGGTPLGTILRLVVWRSFIGGTASVSLIGWWSLLGAWTCLLTVSVVGGSPYAVRWYVRWRSQRPGPSALVQRPDSPPRVNPASRNIDQPSRCARDELSSLSDAALCQAWRVSFSELRDSPSQSQRMRIVEERQQYLDEFERRNPEGLMAWLASGARAAANPSRFIMGSAGVSRHPIDWDGLIPRQDR